MGYAKQLLEMQMEAEEKEQFELSDEELEEWSLDGASAEIETVSDETPGVEAEAEFEAVLMLEEGEEERRSR
ncbi:MAG: hypothetical protein ACYDEA_02450 [Candidatus Dormibacteria bacterium]